MASRKHPANYGRHVPLYSVETPLSDYEKGLLALANRMGEQLAQFMADLADLKADADRIATMAGNIYAATCPPGHEFVANPDDGERCEACGCLKAHVLHSRAERASQQPHPSSNNGNGS